MYVHHIMIDISVHYLWVTDLEVANTEGRNIVKMCVLYTKFKLRKRLEENIFTCISGIVVGSVTGCVFESIDVSTFASISTD